MKLYREVKASERLPDKNWDGVIKTPADDIGIQYYHGTYYELADYDVWLEPIEIAGEDLKQQFEEEMGPVPTKSKTFRWQGVKWLLSKLKGE